MALCMAACGFVAGCSPVSCFAESEYWHQRTSLFDLLPVGEDDIVFLATRLLTEVNLPSFSVCLT